jgi:hypothetical protein
MQPVIFELVCPEAIIEGYELDRMANLLLSHLRGEKGRGAIRKA